MNRSIFAIVALIFSTITAANLNPWGAGYYQNSNPWDTDSYVQNSNPWDTDSYIQDTNPWDTDSYVQDVSVFGIGR